MLSEVEQEQRPSGNGDREAIVVGAGLCDGEGERAYTEYAPTLEGESTENLLPKRLSPAVKTFRHQRRFGNKKLPKRLPPSCCRNVLCRNVRNPTNEQESLLVGTQKNWTQPVYVKTAQDLISRMDDKRSKVFTAHQGKLGSQWLNVVPCKNLGLKLDDQQLRIPIGLRLGVNICVAHTCPCGKRVERDGLHGLSCTKRAGRFSRHATLNSLIKQTLGSLDLPSVLGPRGLNRTDGKRPDGVTMIAWEICKQQVWDVTVVDALAPSRLNQGSLCNPETTTTEADARNIEKYRELIDNGYIFQPVALEVPGSSGESSEIFLMRLCKMLFRSLDDH